MMKKKRRASDIQSVIMTVLSLMTVITSISMGLLLYNRYETAMRQNDVRDAQNMMETIVNSMEQYLKNMRQISDTANYNIIQALDISSPEFNQELSLLYDSNKDKIQSIALYDMEGELLVAEPVTLQKEGVEVSRQSWFENAKAKIENMHFSTPHMQDLFQDDAKRYHWVISLSRAVDVIDGDSPENGILLVDMKYSFIEEMRAIQFTGSCQSAYHYVAACTVKWMNDKLQTFFKDAGLDGKAGWQLFKEKEYLGKLDNQKEVEKLLEKYILRFERDPKEEPELSRFHLFDAKGNVKGVRDMEIVDYLVENVQFFVVGITPYYYEHGVFLEDHDGVRMKYRIQKLIYRDQVQSGVIKRIYNLLITQPKVHREAYELNKQPVRWINFKNGYYDPVTGEMLEHNPDYLTINQIPFPYYPEDREQVLHGGENIKKYLASSLPNKEEQQTFWEYFGYCMTQDTQFQKFLTLKGNGGTGKSVAVSLIQHVVGITNMSSISLQDLNKRFYATGMYGKLLNACADIPCKAMENTDVLKKAVGEDTLIYEKKGQDAIHFHSYAKLLFSTNEMPQNLEDKSDAFYRRLLILDMNRVVKSGEKDLHLKEKVQAESDYAIHMAMIALKNLYEQGKFTESEHSKECVREVQRTSDSICAFIDESLVRAKGKRLKRSEVFHMYEEYCKENGRQGHGKSNFFRNMTDKGFLLKQYNGEFYYQDIAVKEEDFCPVDPEERIPFEETDIDYKQLQLNMNQGIKGI